MGIPVKISKLRPVALVASAALVVGTVGLVSTTSADAAVLTTVLGTVGITNGTDATHGTIDQNINFTTAAGCPANDGAAHATNYAQVTINGGNAGKTWPSVVLVGTSTVGVSHSGAQSFKISDTFTNIAASYGLATPQGAYDVTVTCQDATGANQSGVFRSQFVFDNAGNFTVNPPVLGTLSASVSGAPATSIGTGDAVTWTTSGGCPSPANNTHITIDGTGWAAVDLAGTGTSNFSTSAPISRGQADTLAGIQAANTLPALATGNYVVTATCQNGNGTVVTGTYQTTLAWNATTATGTITNAVSTSTVLSASTPVVVGSTISLSATVTPASGTLPAGTVTFTDETNATVGSVQVTAAGATATATVSASGYAVGTHTFNALFTPGDSSVAGSSALPMSVVVRKATPTATISISPSAPNIYTPVSLTCNVTGGVSGPSQVTFTYTVPGGSATTSSATALSSGSASLSLGSLTAGTLAGVSCTTVADANNVSVASGLTSKSIAGIDPSRVSTEYVDVTVVPGALTLTVKGITAPSPQAKTGTAVASPTTYVAATDYSTNVVILPDAAVNAGGTYIVTSGNMLPVQAVDTRAGALGYSVTGLLGDLTQPAGATHPGDVINAANVGWVPAFISSTAVPGALTAAAAGITDGGITAPAAGIQPGTSSLGLKGSAKTLFTVPSGGNEGTVVYGAQLNLQAPTTTRDGFYEGVLTLTAA